MVGMKIGEYLEENGIKQSFVADKVGITPARMSEIVNKQNKIIDCVLYYKICKVLNVPLELFLEDEE